MTTALYYKGDLKIGSIAGISNSTVYVTGTLAASTITPNSTVSNANVTIKPSGSGILIIDESTVGGNNNSVTTLIATNTYGSYRLTGHTGAAYLALQDSSTLPEVYIGGVCNGSDTVIQNRVCFHYTGSVTEIAGPIYITRYATNLTPKIYYSTGFTSDTAYACSFTNATGPTVIPHLTVDFSGATPTTVLLGRLDVGTALIAAPLNVYGVCTNPTGSWATFADISTKKDITDFSSDIALKVISDLKIKKYKDTVLKSTQIGLISQDVKKTQESFMNDIETMTPKAPDNTYLLNASAIPYLLVSCVQRLIDENDELKAKLDMLYDSIANKFPDLKL